MTIPGGSSTAGRSTTDKGIGVGFRMQEHSRREYYREGHMRKIQEAGAQQEEYCRQGHRRRVQEAGAQQGGIRQTGAQEEYSGGRRTERRSPTDRGTGGGFRRQEHSREEYYRQGHRRRMQDAGAQQEGVLQPRAQEYG
ncbi:hypothetical protein NDU88_011895 [Pleurodeles waltl]|uniref:Uncharacterized protein n=1 Tax=Pleurodeles waltl TaxID=8319 RepID=A0AAV7S513_PLEWA|nr:hypothetical protein NDU88_011895 [Pleurodeles waltl]